ncbi:MAG: hypothetical protein Q7K57_54540 [Burkholderiaceae bacterium]|nr:hypothetical protein [Burkholderiaceae bacterium]
MSHGKSRDKVQPEFNAFSPPPSPSLSMSPLYEVLFLFSAPQGYLAEIKRLNLSAGTRKATVYQWLWIQGTTVTALQFVDMADDPRPQRTFKEGLLWFDDRQGELRFTSGRTVQLATEADKTLPQPLMRLVNLHLS